MELKLDPKQFDHYQRILADEIVERIKFKLREAGLEGVVLEETTGNIASSVTSVIDGLAGIEADGVEVNPYLTFSTEDDELIHCGENSYTHDHLIGALKKAFDS